MIQGTISWFFYVTVTYHAAVPVGPPPQPYKVQGFPSHAACERVRLATQPTAAECRHEVK